MFHQIFYYYHQFITEAGDPRVKNWLMISTPFPVAILLSLYLLFILKIGPAFMKHRKPYELKTFMILYNVAQMAFNTYIVIKGFPRLIENRLYFCQQTEYEITPDLMWMLNISWCVFIFKLLDFIDTIIFVLRKKTNQLTPLHIIHHTIVPVMSWIFMKYVPIGHYSLGPYINIFVHSVMYTYYMLSALGPSIHKYLWWKRYLTTLQLVQFVIVILHSTLTLLLPSCHVPKTIAVVILSLAVFFYVMFTQFYHEAYNKKQQQNSQENGFEQQLLSGGYSNTKYIQKED